MKKNKVDKKLYYSRTYLSAFPKWIRFLFFMNRGLFNGSGWKCRIERLVCWFGKHEYQLYLYSLNCKKVVFEEGQKEIDGYELNFSLVCKVCGNSQEFRGDWKGLSEHRVIKIK